MNIGKSIAICLQIENENYTEEEKALAIYNLLQMPTHNGITKDSLLKIILYMFNQLYEITEN